MSKITPNVENVGELKKRVSWLNVRLSEQEMSALDELRNAAGFCGEKDRSNFVRAILASLSKTAPDEFDVRHITIK
jgi:hypothetical protein